MFTYLCKNVLHIRNQTTVNRPYFLIKFISSDCNKHSNSFTVSYLVNTCGLTQEKAISASKKVYFDTPTKPDSVLTLFKNYGFPNTHMKKMIQLSPQILLLSVDKTLKPKLEFLESKGLSGSALSEALSNHPYILNRSLNNAIIPSFSFLTSFFDNESEKIIPMLKYGMEVLCYPPQQRIAPNVQLLRAYGVPESIIKYLFTEAYRVVLANPRIFKKIVEDVKKMMVDPSQRKFVVIVRVLVYLSKKTLEVKFNVFRKWGWSEDDIQCAFIKQPFCMMLSEKNIMCTMEYLVNKLGYDSLLIAKLPGVLLFSVERRIIPRCSVIQLLVQHGLVDKEQNLLTLLSLSEKKFSEEFVAKFEGKFPEVLNVYQQKDRPQV